MTNLKQIKRDVVSYDVGEGFYVDVESPINLDEEDEVWLYNISCGIKTLMFGFLRKDITGPAQLEDMILSYLEPEKKYYMNKFMSV